MQSASDTEKVKSAVRVIQAVAEAIRELKEIPSGHLYAQLMGKMSLDTYNQIIATLKNAGLVKEEFHYLTWIEPIQKSEVK